MNKQLMEDMGLDGVTEFAVLEDLVVAWASDKGILEKSDVKSQYLKTVSEVGELADAVNKGDMDEVRDAIGDILVTLIILAKLYRQSGEVVGIEQSLEGAYNIIAKRTGKMINGVFVKSEDLKE